MRIANTLRLTAHSRTPHEQEELLAVLKQFTPQPAETETLTHPEYPTLYVTKLWLTKQPDIRIFLKFIAQLPEQDKATLREQIPQRTDDRGNLYLRLEKKAFLEHAPAFVEKGDVVQLRINLAAHPKNTRTIHQKALQLLSASDKNL